MMLRVLFIILSFYIEAFSAATGSLCRYSVSDLYFYDQGWVNVVVPTNQGFEIQKIADPLQISKLQDSATLERQRRIDASLNEATNHYNSIVEKLKQIAIFHHAHLKTRMKDPDSLRQKIIDRVRSYPQSRAQMFRPEDLHDVIGARLIVKTGTPLHRFDSTKSVWARLLKIPEENIYEVEIKGGDKECARGKCYRAVHLVIEHKKGVRYELQIHSRAVSHWHSWDHAHVYKNTTLAADQKVQMAEYSRKWIQTIRLLEDYHRGVDTRAALQELHADLDINFAWNSWPSVLDQKLANLYGVSFNHRFLIKVVTKKSIAWPETNRELVRDLTNLTLPYHH